jgi:hypothetical protein
MMLVYSGVAAGKDATRRRPASLQAAGGHLGTRSWRKAGGQMHTRPVLLSAAVAVILTAMAAFSAPAGATVAQPPGAAGQPPAVRDGLGEVVRDIVGDLFFGRHHGDRHGHRHGEGDDEGDDEGGHRHHHHHHDDATFQAALVRPSSVGQLTAMGLRDDDNGGDHFLNSVLGEVVAGVDDVTEITDATSDLVDFGVCQFMNRVDKDSCPVKHKLP